MWVLAAMSAVFSVITGGGKRVEIQTHADPLYRHIIVTAEWKFWGCVESGEPPCPFGVDPPKARIEAIVSDQFVVSPCRGHHHDAHAYKGEAAWSNRSKHRRTSALVDASAAGR
jgi:hypothetical protein